MWLRGWLQRDLGSPSLRLLWVALLLAMAMVTGVASFNERLHHSLVARSSELLGADRVLRSADEPPATLLQQADALGLSRASLMSLQSMVFVGERLQLASVYAVDSAYPLRGQVTLGDGRRSWKVAVPPAIGHVWLEPRLAELLGVSVGDTLELGALTLTVEALIEQAPGGSWFNGWGGALWMQQADLAGAQLLNPGSRVRYRTLFAGPSEALEQLALQIDPASDLSLQSPGESQPRLGSALDRAQRYLLLASSLVVLTCGAAGALAALRFAQSRRDPIAVLKTLGASRRQVALLLGGQLGLLWLSAWVLAQGLGWGLTEGLALGMRQVYDTELAPGGAIGAWLSAAVGGLLLLSFVWPVVARLIAVPPVRVLRGGEEQPLALHAGMVTVALLGSFGLLWLFAGQWQLAAVLIAGLLLLLLTVTLLLHLLWQLLARLPLPAASPWALGVQRLRQRRWQASAMTAVITLALTLGVSVAVVRAQLVDQWGAQLPDETPNLFLVNIAPQEREALETLLTRHGRSHTGLFPMAPARVTAINGEPLSARPLSEDGQMSLGREINLSHSAELPPGNEVVAGDWLAEGASLEQEFAARIGVGLGDRLTFQAGGQSITLPVTSLRRLSWDSFRPNFYILLPEQALAQWPATWITSVYWPAAGRAGLLELVRAFPSLTLMDLEQVLGQIRGIVQQVSLAVSAVLVLVMVAGLLVLTAAVRLTLAMRAHESALWRALGASQRQLLGATLAEFALLGGGAGVLAVLAGESLGWWVAQYWLELPWQPTWLLWWLVPLLGLSVVGVTGYLGSRRACRTPPASLLR